MYRVIDYTSKYYSNYFTNFTKHLLRINSFMHSGFIGCCQNKDKKLIYLHIDKCASQSFFYSLIEKYNFIDMTNLDNQDQLLKDLINQNYLFFTVVRDIKLRYISSVIENIIRYNLHYNYIESELKQNKFIFDDHTAPQHCFIDMFNIPEEKIKYVKLDNNLNNKISNILNEPVELLHINNLLSNLMGKHISKIKKIEIKNQIINLFDKYCENNSEFEKLYKKDNNLYQKAK